MADRITVSNIYEHNINFLIGAGASAGLFPTLGLKIKCPEGKKETIETLATKLSDIGGKEKVISLLFMYYFEELIKPAIDFRLDDDHDADGLAVINNYEIFVKSIIRLLNNKPKFSRRCNLFTTNYDGCIPLIADRIHSSGTHNFVLNDGTRGFLTKSLSVRNYDAYTCQTGVFGKGATDIPQINLINIHGSVYWSKNEDKISVNYDGNAIDDLIPEGAKPALAQLKHVLESGDYDSSHLLSGAFDGEFELSEEDKTTFLDRYNAFPIVNPTKWKFHETVFDEHYYQMLRMLTFELEREHSVLITFGFSFADEHILSLVKRSLGNPTLQIFICCYTQEMRVRMQEEFRGFSNITYVSLENEKLNFDKFNDQVFVVNNGFGD